MAEIDRGKFGEPPRGAGAKSEILLPRSFFPKTNRIYMPSVIDVSPPRTVLHSFIAICKAQYVENVESEALEAVAR